MAHGPPLSAVDPPQSIGTEGIMGGTRGRFLAQVHIAGHNAAIMRDEDATGQIPDSSWLSFPWAAERWNMELGVVLLRTLDHDASMSVAPTGRQLGSRA